MGVWNREGNYRKNVDPWVKKPNDNGAGKTEIVSGVFVSLSIPQPAWEEKGWRRAGSSRLGTT